MARYFSLREAESLIPEVERAIRHAIRVKADYVAVTGQVFNPTAIGYKAGRSAKWYLSQAGGLTPCRHDGSRWRRRQHNSPTTVFSGICQAVTAPALVRLR